MQIINCQQNSPEWYKLRLGIPTASNFDKIVTSTGEPSKQRTKYLWQLAGERVSGVIEESYQNANMQRGTMMQEEAKKFYEIVNGVIVNEVGFCTEDGLKYGCSPDGLIDNDGGLEIKCPTIAVHVGYLINKVVPTEYIQQIQGNLFVTGREWWDFLSYYPGLKPLLIRVTPDEKFFKAFEKEINIFNAELDSICEIIA